MGGHLHIACLHIAGPAFLICMNSAVVAAIPEPLCRAGNLLVARIDAAAVDFAALPCDAMRATALLGFRTASSAAPHLRRLQRRSMLRVGLRRADLIVIAIEPTWLAKSWLQLVLVEGVAAAEDRFDTGSFFFFFVIPLMLVRLSAKQRFLGEVLLWPFGVALVQVRAVLCVDVVRPLFGDSILEQELVVKKVSDEVLGLVRFVFLRSRTYSDTGMSPAL